MSYEISQTEISGIQLRESKTQPKVSHSREIGEAQIVHTIFGRAKVRIIRKHDKFRRVLWLTAVIGVAAISAFVWQGWYADQQTEPMQRADTVPLASVPSNEKASVAPTEDIVIPAIRPAAVVEPVEPASAETGKSLIGEKRVPQPQAAMKAAGKETVKPVIAKPKPAATQPKLVSQSEATGKPQALPGVANKNAPKMQAATPPATKPIPPKQPVAADITTMPAAAKAVAPASSPAAIPVLGAPLVKEDVPTQAPVPDKQLAAPLNLQSK